MPFSNSYANSILNYAFAKTKTLNAPSSVYIGLCTNNPETTSGAIEELPDVGGYSRVLIALREETYPNFISPASDRAITNAHQINWAKATLDWARVNGFFLSSSSTVGETSNIFFYGALELDEDVKAAGGLLVEAGAVALFDPNTFIIKFPEQDADMNDPE